MNRTQRGRVFPKLITLALIATAVASIWFVQSHRVDNPSRAPRSGMGPKSVVPGAGQMADQAASPPKSTVALQITPHKHLDAEILFNLNGSLLGSAVVRSTSSVPDATMIDLQPGRYTVVIRYRNPRNQHMVDSASVPLAIEDAVGVPVLDLDGARVSRLPFAPQATPSTSLPTLLPSTR